ncbi:MAG: hypothetical protein OXU19_18715 [bacterium]|nr:hypothetical protein [bacterium]
MLEQTAVTGFIDRYKCQGKLVALLEEQKQVIVLTLSPSGSKPAPANLTYVMRQTVFQS